jgi:hypothetical protein
LPRLNDKQRNIYDRIAERQYQRVLANDFLALSEAAQTKILNGVADDISGMILRRLATPSHPTPVGHHLIPCSRKAREFSAAAHNYYEVDFVANAEVVLDRTCQGGSILYGQLDFVERLYITGELGRIDFGVRRAYLSIAKFGPGEINRVDALKGATGWRNAASDTSRFT